MFLFNNIQKLAVIFVLVLGLASITWTLEVDLNPSEKVLSNPLATNEQQYGKVNAFTGEIMNKAGDSGLCRQDGEAVTPVKIKEERYSRFGNLFRIETNNFTIGAKFPRRPVQQIVFTKPMTTGQLIDAAGYKWDEHEVKTEDGYYLTMFRILPPCASKKRNGAVLFQHGFLGSSSEWLLGNLENALPLIFASYNFEVWLMNSRGNEYSMKHETLSSKSPKFWDFSFDEMGRYDLKAAFDYIIKLEQEEASRGKKEREDADYFLNRRIFFVGNALGNAMFYIFMSLNGQAYKNYITTMMAISPTAFISRTTSPIKALAPFTKVYKAFQQNGPLLSSTLASFLHFSIPELCPLKKHGLSLCSAALFLTHGQFSNDENATTIQNVYRHFPSSTSIKTLVHYLQLTEVDEFRNFDYGPAQNFIKYRQTVPHEYNLFRVNVSSINFYGEKDIFLDRKDVEKTISQLGVSGIKLNILFLDHQSTDFLYRDVAPVIVKLRAFQFLFDQYQNETGLNREDVACECECNASKEETRTSSSYFSQFIHPL